MARLPLAREGSLTPAPGGGVALAPAGRLRPVWVLAGVAAMLIAAVAGLMLGPAGLSPFGALVEVANMLPGVSVDSGLTPLEAGIVTRIRLPRVVLGLLVGAMLALAGGCYQGAFRNPLADPYLLGVAAGAGLGVTVVIALRVGDGSDPTTGLPMSVPIAAFVGAIAAVVFTYVLGGTGGGRRSPATLLLAGVAVSAFFAACQTYLLQRHSETIRQVYGWLLGRLSSATWHDVRLILPYALITVVVLLLLSRELDVLSVGDEEAAALGMHPQRSRLVLVAVASLGAAAAVSVSGLIGFVGVIVPHVVRLLVGTSYRVILPISALFGAAFLTLADVAARMLDAPAEIPIGVVTAFLGAPFFVLVLRTMRWVAP